MRNPMNPKMEFSPAEVLALEVEQWPALEAERNLIPNPWPDPLAYGWAIDWNTAGVVGTDHEPALDESWRRPARAGVITALAAIAPRIVQITTQQAPAALGVAVGDVVFVQNVPELQRPNVPGSEWNTDVSLYPLRNANGAQPQYLTVTAVTSTTITADIEANPPALTVGALTVPANAFLRTGGATFAVFTSSDQAGKVIGNPWDVVVRTADIPVTAGRWIRFGADVTGHIRAMTETSANVWGTASGDTHTIAGTYRFHDADGVQVSTSTWSRPGGAQTNTSRPIPLDNPNTVQVPAGAVSVRVEIKVTLSTSTYLSNVKVSMPFSAARLYQATTSAGVPASGVYLTPPPPVEIFGDIAGGLRTGRQALDACTMSFQLRGDAYDPLQSDVLTPGKRVQLRLTNPITGEVSELFTGAIADPLQAEYPVIRGKVVPITKVTCVDPLPRFAKAPQADGVYGWRSLRDVLEAVPSPSLVQAAVPITESSTVPYWIDQGSVLDHVVIARDTWQAYAWIDRRGILRVMDRDAITEGGWYLPPRTFDVDESSFMGSTTPSYDSERVINVVRIKALRHIGDQTEEWNYGPYVDAASFQKHGPREATFTVSTSPFETYPDNAFAAYAADILARSSVPALLFSPVPFRIRKLTDLDRASADLMDVFRVTSPAAGYVNVPMRAWSITHEITVDSWTMTAEFERESETQTPTLTTSPAGNGARTPTDLSSSKTNPNGLTYASSLHTTENSRVSFHLRNGTIYVDGIFFPRITAHAAAMVSAIPEMWRPEWGWRVVAGTNATAGRYDVDIQTDGDIALLKYNSAPADMGTSYVTFTTSYPLKR